MNLNAFENLRLELRRVCLVLAVLAKLRSEYHGYGLVQALREGGLEIDENMLYPLLRRLEKQKLLASPCCVEEQAEQTFLSPVRGWASCTRVAAGGWRNINGALEKLSEAPTAARRRKA